MDRVIHAYGAAGRPRLHAVPPVQLDRRRPRLDPHAEGRLSRVITQFFGHIVRGENIKLVDGGAQKRAFTYIDDGIDALMKIIENKDGIARQDLQHRQPAQQITRSANWRR
jgi:nucleoside-diphosphate-sugar epimerase